MQSIYPLCNHTQCLWIHPQVHEGNKEKGDSATFPDLQMTAKKLKASLKIFATI